MRALIGYFVRHRTAANLTMLGVLTLGLFAATEIRRQFFPDVTSETATVRVVWEGAGSEEVDAGVVAALEPLIRAVDGVEETRTLARDGLASIVATFEPGADLDAGVEEIRAALDAARTLPEDAEAPTISRGRFLDRVTNVMVSGAAPLEALSLVAEDLRAALFAAGVSRVEIEGALPPDIIVEPSEAALRRHDLSFRDIAAAIAVDAAARPAGADEQDGARVRAGVDRRSVAELRAIPVRSGAGGERLLLGDVARVYDVSADPVAAEGRVALFADNAPAIRLVVGRNAAGDAVDIQAAVERVVAEAAAQAPEDVRIALTETRAQAISDRLDMLMRNAVSGLALVMALLFLFLSARTAFWVAAGVPVSMFAAVGVLYLTDQSLNMLSLFALILCLGIVVDDAIVVGEHADALAKEGLAPEEAATRAAERMAVPVVAATATTVIAFSALLLIEGRFGDWLAVLPVTVAATLGVSLIECFIVLPAHMRHALEHGQKRSWIDAPSRAVTIGFDWVRDRAVRPIIRLCLRLRYVMLAGGVGLIASAAALQTSGAVPWLFFRSPENSVIRANFAMAPGATRADTMAQLRAMQEALDRVRRDFAALHGADPVVSAAATLGAGVGRGLSIAETKEPDQLGGFTVELIDADLRDYEPSVFVSAWEAAVSRHPQLERLAMSRDRGGPGRDDIEIELYGDALGALRLVELKAASEALIDALGGVDGVSGLEDSLARAKPTRILTLTPKGRALGFTPETVAAELAARLEGLEALRFPIGGFEGRVRVRAAQSDIALSEIWIESPSGARAAVADVATIAAEPSFASVKRLDGRLVVTVTGGLVEDPAARAAIERRIAEEILPDIEARFGVRAEEGGLKRQERDFLSDATLGAGLCVIGIYICLAWALNSWRRPVVILFAIPFGYVGAIWGHYWHDMPLSMFSVVGLMGMAGVIVNDAIVLLTAIDEKAERRPLFEAAVDGACDRLRAVFLTTATTVGGLAPLLFETSRQALFLQPTVITLVYGLGFGMVIVLVLTPALLLIGQDLKLRLGAFRRLLRWMTSRRSARLGGAL